MEDRNPIGSAAAAIAFIAAGGLAVLRCKGSRSRALTALPMEVPPTPPGIVRTAQYGTIPGNHSPRGDNAAHDPTPAPEPPALRPETPMATPATEADDWLELVTDSHDLGQGDRAPRGWAWAHRRGAEGNDECATNDADAAHHLPGTDVAAAPERQP